MINSKKYRHEDDKKPLKEEKDKLEPIPPSSSSNNNSNITTTSIATDKDKTGIRGGVIRNGIYYSETELAEQSNMAWSPCYWTREKINKWVEEVENPDALKTLPLKTLSSGTTTPM